MRALPLLSAALSSLLATRAAVGATCYAQRPTEPGATWSYAGATAAAFDTPEGNVRIRFALEGPHAPAGASAEQTPVAALVAGAVAEAALVRFGALGFRLPLPHGPDSPCSGSGHDDRVDIYLYAFNAADGTVILDQCVNDGTERCAGFAIIENDFAGKGYASPDEGYRTVVPHELFHLVQAAYSTNSEAWWAEGTAQWAAKQVFPDLQDLEAFLPAFFQRTNRPLDFPPVGAAASFSYGAAIWPLFLTERFEAPVVRSAFEELGEDAADALDATGAVLEREGSSLDSAFVAFAMWNAATGARAGSGGYRAAASYPEVTLETLPEDLPSRTSGTLAGLSARYFRFLGGEHRRLDVASNAARLSARFVPLVGDEARVANVTALPVETSDPGILVLSGRTRDHRDVSFTILVDQASAATGGASSGGAEGGPTENGGGAGADEALAHGGESSGGRSDDAGVTDPNDSDEGGAAPSSEVTTSARLRSGGGCSLVPEAPPRPSSWNIVASLAAGAGLGRLAERTWRRRAAPEGHSRRAPLAPRGGTFEYRH